MEWIEVSEITWKPEKPGESISGVLEEKFPKSEDVSARYVILANDSRYLVWGSAVLDRLMRVFEMGDTLKIEYGGMGKNNAGKDMKLFKVFRGKKEEGA